MFIYSNKTCTGTTADEAHSEPIRRLIVSWARFSSPPFVSTTAYVYGSCNDATDT